MIKKIFSLFKQDIKLICFDVDNTLCDSNSAESETEAIMIQKLEKELTEKYETKIIDSKKTKQSEKILSAIKIIKIFTHIKNSHLHHDLEPEKYSRSLWLKETIEKINEENNSHINSNKLDLNPEKFEEEYWENYSKLLRNYPNTISTLTELKRRGFKLAIVSDSDGKSGIKTKRLQQIGLDKYFDYIILGDDVGFNKPHPKNWEDTLKISGFKAKECIMIGDHPDVDLVTAKKIGFITIWTKESLNIGLHHNYVDYEIKDIGEVLKIVNKICKKIR